MILRAPSISTSVPSDPEMGMKYGYSPTAWASRASVNRRHFSNRSPLRGPSALGNSVTSASLMRMRPSDLRGGKLWVEQLGSQGVAVGDFVDSAFGGAEFPPSNRGSSIRARAPERARGA